MPKFKRDDKVKLKPDAKGIASDHGDGKWHPCWSNAMGSVGKVLGGSGSGKCSTIFPTINGNFWIYEDMLMLIGRDGDHEDESFTDTVEIHKLLDRLIKGA